MRNLALAIGLAVALCTTSLATTSAAQAQAMSVEQFLASAARIPRNPTALLHPATRRLIGEVRGSFKTLGDQQRAAVVAGQRPVTCIPERVSVSPEDVLNRMNAIHASRRSISVTQALREWMIERYPCR